MKKSQVTKEFWEEQLPNTLYNRLEDAEAKKLDAIATRFPNSARVIREAFKNATLIYDVEFHILESCRGMLDWDLNNVHQYFKPIGQ